MASRSGSANEDSNRWRSAGFNVQLERRRQMIVIGEFLWPPEKSTDIGKALLEAGNTDLIPCQNHRPCS